MPLPYFVDVPTPQEGTHESIGAVLETKWKQMATLDTYAVMAGQTDDVQEVFAHSAKSGNYPKYDLPNGANRFQQQSSTNEISHEEIVNGSINEDSGSGFWHIDFANGVEYVKYATDGAGHAKTVNGSINEDSDIGFWHIDYANGVEYVNNATNGAGPAKTINASMDEDSDSGFWHIDYASGVEHVKYAIDGPVMPKPLTDP